MKTIVYAHPYEGSLNHAILARMTAYFTKMHQDYQVIDLYRDGFDPRYSKEELRLFSRGETPYQLVKDYQRLIKQSDELLFITPIWWHQLPAELKGFFDKVMLKGFAYEENPAWRGLLTYIHKATVITTATYTKSSLQTQSGDPIQRNLIDRTFADIGIDPQKSQWIHLGEANTTTDAVRQQFLADLPALYLHGQD
ncbi:MULTISPECIES: NAD(P)H-dependent oxidoreductase [Lactobacillaceae]|uniref:NAD(P)H-dependent oxidoreductase n=1 Tax=Lactobacillaceae TaxID=33958 RepID=UPI0014574020|nr:NAD(P)H-dependent oxidoreductase [Lactobacillus sp. HBUAS51381]NLR10346.1 NAD(P)H-dependent oxidoreductase [Lactobacillus sp. HBUAS51381]